MVLNVLVVVVLTIVITSVQQFITYLVVLIAVESIILQSKAVSWNQVLATRNTEETLK